MGEVDDRDWVQAEREYLEKIVQRDEDVQKRRRRNQNSADGGGGGGVWRTHTALLTLWTGTCVAAVMAACTVLRTHLFIWTVFSPKFLFVMAWGVAWQFGVVVGLGGLLWSVGRW